MTLKSRRPLFRVWEDLGERIDHCDYPDGKVLLLGFPDRHINHSCDPNSYEFFEGEVSYLVAIRDISAGEEITCDYNVNITGGRPGRVIAAPAAVARRLQVTSFFYH